MISFGGIASGFDTNAIISGLVGVERLGVQRIQQRRSETNQAISQYTALSGRLEKLRDIAEQMSDNESFGKLSASSSDEDVLTVTSNGEASAASYDIEVQQTAQAHKVMSDATADPNVAGAMGEGDLDLTINGETTTVSITGDMTLRDIKEAINASGADANASIVNDGNGYRLMVSAGSSGVDNAITFGQGGTLALNLGDPANELTEARDARIIVDGVLQIDSDDNQLSDVIEGLTLDLNKAKPGEQIRVDISKDSTAQADAMKEFIDAYNDVVSFVNQQTKANGEADRGMLVGDPTMRSVISQLRGVIQQTVNTGSSFNNLSAIGITTSTSNGALELDQGDLDKALEADFNGVLEFFTNDTDGLAKRLEETIDAMVKDDGLLDTRKDGLGLRVDDLDKQITNQNRRIDAYEARLQAQFLAMEQAISGLNNQSSFLQAQLGG